MSRIVPSDEHHGFVFWLSLRVLLPRDFVNPNVMMSKHPICIDVMNHGTPGDRASHHPASNHPIEQWMFSQGGHDWHRELLRNKQSSNNYHKRSRAFMVIVAGLL